MTGSAFTLVTGAGGIIGRQVVQDLLNKGHHVVALDISTKGFDSFHYDSNITQLIPYVCDLTIQENLEKLFPHLINKGLKIKALVHTAYPRTVNWCSRFEDLTAHDLSLNLNYQLALPILLAQQACLYYVQGEGGDIVLLSSIQGISAPKFEHYSGTDMTSPIEYTAIKSGIIGITKWLAKYYANSNIRVNCVSPGGVLNSQPLSFMQKYRESCTSIGLLSPKHVSDAVIFLLAQESIAINGQNIIVDDGWSL